ncbi:MAG: Pvc16 family protein [Desulfobacteraceae bacterium]|jgi:hypothetical protein
MDWQENTLIEHLDNLLRHLLISEIDEITDESQVRFQPPDDSWRSYVTSLTVEGQPVNALNVYLWDVRENRKLRSNERMRVYEQQTVLEMPVPKRIDCHYLISAWSPAQITPGVEPTLDEHALLYKVASVLANNDPLVPRSVYEPDPPPPTLPEIIVDAHLPTCISPSEGFPKLAEFWGSVNWRWKPGVYLVVTLPVVMNQYIAGPMVTTRITEYRHADAFDTCESFIQICGCVMDATVDPVLPIAGAWVQLEANDGTAIKTTATNHLGQYTFARLQPGTYRLRWRAIGRAEPAPRVIEVPSPTGAYDLKFE